MTEVSNTRLYLGNLPRNATKADIEKHFGTHGTGEIVEVKMMSGFGFIEYKDHMDARDVVPAFHGSMFMGERLTVQFARGARNRETARGPERGPPRPRRTPYRMQITGLPGETSWQDLKDFARQSGLDVVYSETGRDSNGKGFVEFETAADLDTAVEKLDGFEFKGESVQCEADVQADMPPPPERRGRSRSPGRRGGPYNQQQYGGYDRRGGPPRRDPGAYGYRDRSPRRDYYDDRGPRYRSPPRRPPQGPMDGYGPPRGRYDDGGYGRRDYMPPPTDAYGNGRDYDRGPPPPPPPPPRDMDPRDPRDAYPPREPYPPREYDRDGRYW